MPGSDVVVIGGGVIGSSTAYQLAKRGLDVTLLEATEIASKASGASAGGVRQQGRDPRELEIAMRAIAMWPDLSDELEADLDYHQDGHLTLVETESDYETLTGFVSDQRERGLDVRMIDQAELRTLAPGVGPTFFAAGWCPTDGHANPIYTTKAFANAAQNLGADIREFTPATGLISDSGRVTAVETPNGVFEAKWVINAAGAWASSLCQSAGFSLPVEAHGLQMIVTEEMPMELFPVLGCMSQQISLKQLGVGKYLIGGGWPATVYMNRPQPIGQNKWQSIAGSADAATIVWPILEQVGIHRVWSGLEAIAEDGVPIIGPVPQIDGLLVAAGFSGHGFALSPYIGVILAELVSNGRAPLPIQDLQLNRFQVRTA